MSAPDLQYSERRRKNRCSDGFFKCYLPNDTFERVELTRGLIFRCKLRGSSLTDHFSDHQTLLKRIPPYVSDPSNETVTL